MNQRNDKSVYLDEETPGGSAQTFKGMYNYMVKHRPTIVFYENVKDIDKEKKNRDPSDLTVLIQKWGEIGYECQVILVESTDYGLPQHRDRSGVIGLLIDVPLASLKHRAPNTTFTTLRAMLRVCSVSYTHLTLPTKRIV